MCCIAIGQTALAPALSLLELIDVFGGQVFFHALTHSRTNNQPPFKNAHGISVAHDWSRSDEALLTGLVVAFPPHGAVDCANLHICPPANGVRLPSSA
jgi:hypothetical protein